MDELLASAQLLPLSHTNIRTPVSSVISATDSSGARGGSCQATVTERMSRLLHRRSEFRGEHGRLAWNVIGEMIEPTSMTEPDVDLDDLLASLPWRSPKSYLHKGAHHINVQEMRAIYEELLFRTYGQNESKSRWVCAVDSRVAVGALAKGRSSSKALNSWLRKIAVVSLTSGNQIRPLWVGTKANPADDPSRGVPLRPSAPPPCWSLPLWDRNVKRIEALKEALDLASDGSTSADDSTPRSASSTSTMPSNCSPTSTSSSSAFSVCSDGGDEGAEPLECTVCDDLIGRGGLGAPGGANSSRIPLCPEVQRKAREYYAGRGCLSKALNKKFICCEPFELYGPEGVRSECDMTCEEVIAHESEAARNHEYSYALFGVTCASWSTINKINHGTRTKELPREIQGNLEHDQMFKLIEVYLQENIGFSVENPLSSYIWHTEKFQELMARPDVFTVDLDQCCYCLRPPDAHLHSADIRVKKSTRIVTNVPQLCALRRSCDRSHTHAEALGWCRDKEGKRVSRAKAAGAYPPSLCRVWAEAVQKFLDGESP